jgi:PPOX class probable F420-dependent enzyme
MDIDTSTPFGERVARRLRDETVVWLVTVSAAGQPEPSPVWFVWDGETFLIYSLRDTSRERNLADRPRVALHFDSTRGGDVVVFNGQASIDPSAPPVHEHPEYVAKYRDDFTRIGYTPEQFAARYSLAIRVRPTRLRGHL